MPSGLGREMYTLSEDPRTSRAASGEIAIKIAARRVSATLNHAKGRQRLLGNRPSGNRRIRYTISPNIRIQTQLLIQSIALPPASAPGCASRAYNLYPELLG